MKKTPLNLMDIKLNYVYALALTQIFVYDQTKNFLLGIFHESLGPQKAFQFWWMGFLVENLGQWTEMLLYFQISTIKEFIVSRLFLNVIVYFVANLRLPEFSGLEGKVFPGQPPPSPMIPLPRRMELPPNFPSEWKNIGSRRTQFEYLGMPRPRHPKILLVRSSESRI